MLVLNVPDFTPVLGSPRFIHKFEFSMMNLKTKLYHHDVYLYRVIRFSYFKVEKQNSNVGKKAEENVLYLRKSLKKDDELRWNCGKFQWSKKTALKEMAKWDAEKVG